MFPSGRARFETMPFPTGSPLNAINDGDGTRRAFRRPRCRSQRDDYIYVARDQFSGKRRKAVQLSVGPAIGNRESMPLDAAEFAKACAELVNERVRVRGVVEHAHIRQALRAPGLLRARRERPGNRRTAKCS